MAKICYLASASVSHTVKWVNYFALKGHEVHLLSFEEGKSLSSDVHFHLLGPKAPASLRYFLAAFRTRQLIWEINPDIVHAHYATGYGFLGRFAGFHPYILSVWGMDVFEFPQTSPLHRFFLRSNLNSADHVCSTSHVMVDQTARFYERPITVTPFGVDCRLFKPMRSAATTEFVVGTVKALEPKYGVEYLLRGFAKFCEKHSHSCTPRLVIAGGGFLLEPLQKLAEKLGIAGVTEFLGSVPHSKVPEVLNRMSVFAALSISDSESFGVAVVEASACGLPVVVSKVGGLPEVVQHERTGLIVPPRDPDAVAEAFARLLDEQLRRNLGEAGRQYVLQNYEWEENASRMERLYTSLLNSDRTVQLAS